MSFFSANAIGFLPGASDGVGVVNGCLPRASANIVFTRQRVKQTPLGSASSSASHVGLDTTVTHHHKVVFF